MYSQTIGMLYFFMVLYSLQITFIKSEFLNDSTEIETPCENISSTCSPMSEHITESSLFSMETESSQNLSPKTTMAVTAKATESSKNLTTELITQGPESMKESKNSSKKYCHCDITPDNCDINCCCDADCNSWERAAFSSCIHEKPKSSGGHCLSTDIIYKNNNPHTVTRNVGGLLCISKDNFPERNAYIEQEVIKDIHSFEKVWRRKKHFLWQPSVQRQLKSFEKKDIYKVGDPLWKYHNATDELTSLGLPASMTSPTSICQRQKLVSYLNDFKSVCLQVVPRNEQECNNKELNARSYCQDLILIASPSLVNSSNQFVNSSDEAFVKVKIYQCDYDSCNDTNLFSEPVFSKENTCLNSVLKVHLLLRHNGSMGITDALCKVTLGTPSSINGLFKQTFEVEFVSVLLNSSLVFQRSGTPGYIDNMPVITVLLKNNKDHIRSSVSAVSGENCRDLTPVLFRENARIQCNMKFPLKSSLNCTSLDEQIINLMLQGVGKVGVTGDPVSWIDPPSPLVTASTATSPCLPVSLLSLRFMYAYRGPLTKPEAKIVGFMTQFDRYQILKCSNLSQMCSIKLVTMIYFSDVSRPVVGKYASAPVVKIKLPQDFFYPFSSRAFNLYKSTDDFIFLFCFLLCMNFSLLVL